jgi:hypothetical protein
MFPTASEIKGWSDERLLSTFKAIWEHNAPRDWEEPIGDIDTYLTVIEAEFDARGLPRPCAWLSSDPW